MDGFMWQTWLKQASGDPAGAQAVVQRAHQISEIHGQMVLDDWWVLVTGVRLNVMQGYLEDALRWARSTELDLENLSNLEEYLSQPPAYFRVSVLYALARLFLVLGSREKTPGALEKAHKILACLLPLNEELGQYAALLEGLILSAQVEQALGQPDQAQEFLHRALDLGAPERSLRIFLDEGQPLMALLAERRALDLPPTERVYLEEILAAWSVETSQTVASQPTTQLGLIEPLSFRELEVLRWLAEGKSNQQIAAGLVLSLNTVKKHVSTIMDKLNASNRTQAVQIARQLGIIKS
jgi:LuxR family maltose regulon positive regulatory protein